MGHFKIVVVLLIVSVVHVLTVTGQSMPVFLGQNTPTVPGPQFGYQGSSVGPSYMGSSQMSPPIANIEPWSPGEPRWVFPSTPIQWLTSCQRLGCVGVGVQCVFWGSLCPTSVRGVPCQCRRGCRVDTVFIPYGGSRVMDACNNVCACRSREGFASCTSRRC